MPIRPELPLSFGSATNGVILTKRLTSAMCNVKGLMKVLDGEEGEVWLQLWEHREC